MKNKKNIYILFPAVILIWSILIYKIVAATKPMKAELQVETAQFKPLQLQESATFTVNTNYRDPFLGTISQKKKVKPKKRTVKVAKQKPKVPFPKIIYKGVVSSKGKKSQVFLIAINGQQFFFKRNQTQNEVKLLRGNSKEVVLKFQGQQQTFPIVE